VEQVFGTRWLQVIGIGWLHNIGTWSCVWIYGIWLMVVWCIVRGLIVGYLGVCLWYSVDVHVGYMLRHIIDVCYGDELDMSWWVIVWLVDWHMIGTCLVHC